MPHTTDPPHPAFAAFQHPYLQFLTGQLDLCFAHVARTQPPATAAAYFGAVALFARSYAQLPNSGPRLQVDLPEED